MYEVKVINAGRCMICGREINKNKFPDIFFCKRCAPETNSERMKTQESEVQNANSN